MFTWTLLVILLLITPLFHGLRSALYSVPENKRFEKSKLPTSKAEIILNYVCAIPLIAIYLSLGIGYIPGSRVILGIALLVLSIYYIFKIIRSFKTNIGISFLIGFSLYTNTSKITATLLMLLLILVAFESLNIIPTAAAFYNHL